MQHGDVPPPILAYPAWPELTNGSVLDLWRVPGKIDSPQGDLVLAPWAELMGE